MKKTVFNISLAAMAFPMISACADKVETKSDDASVAVSQQADNKQAEPEMTSETKLSSVIRSADSHTHGGAELAIVLEDNVVTFELESPLYNLLGFEHYPETEAQKSRVKMAEDKLKQGQGLFVLNSQAECSLISENKTVELFEEDHEDHEDSHKDVLLQYQYRCAAPASLSNVSVNLFEFFEDMSDIDVTYLGPATQTQVSMTRKNPQMKLSR